MKKLWPISTCPSASSFCKALVVLPFVLFGLLPLSSCSARAESDACTSHADCVGQSVCREGLCRPTCNYNSDCAFQDFVCDEGACMPATPQLRDASVDADFSDRALSDQSGRDQGWPDHALADLVLSDQTQADQQANDLSRPDSFVPDAAQQDRAQSDRAVETDSGLCPDGQHDGGDGNCVAEGTCSAGYHDSGLGVCAPEPFCAVGFHDGGNGDCVAVGSCLDGYHDGGDGSCIAEGTCSVGFHDGGDGSCLEIGQCAENYSLYYVDVDADGFGAGEQSEDCTGLPPSPHMAIVDGDCDDGDPGVHDRATYYPDKDNDGYTGAAESLCASSAPSGYKDAPVSPPYVSFAAADFLSTPGTDGDIAWFSPGHAYLHDEVGVHSGWYFSSHSHPSYEFIATDFTLDIPLSAQILGLQVHVFRRAASNDHINDRQLTLYNQGLPLGPNRAVPGDWPDDVYTEQIYGGGTDLWDSHLTPAIVNDQGFGVLLQVDIDGGSGFIPISDTAYIDNIWLEVFTDQANVDCDDDDGSVWTLRQLRVDLDGDGYGAGNTQALCVGTAVPAGFASASKPDCLDSSVEAHPWQYSYFEVDRGDGSFDYDCDGSLNKGYISKDTGCTWNSDNSSCSSSGSEEFTNAAACGQNNSVPRCNTEATSSFSCVLLNVTVVTTCH